MTEGLELMHDAALTETLSGTGPALGAEAGRRLARTQAAIAERGLSGLLVYANGETPSAGSVRFLTGWVPARDIACWVPANGALDVVCADKNAARAWALVCGETVRVHKVGDLIEGLRQVLAGAGLAVGAPVGVDGLADATMARHADLLGLLAGTEVIESPGLLPELRSAPTLFEADRLRAATAVADAMVQRCMEVAATPGARARDLMVEVEYLGRRLGAEDARCWIVTGVRPPETYMQLFELDDVIDRAGRVQIGTTVRMDGSYSQVLRIGMFREPDRRMQSVADRLLEMQDATLAAMVPGAPVTVIGDTLESMIDEFCPYARAEDPFRFQACHAMGNSYVEPWAAPFLDADRDHSADASAVALMPNQAFEIHPNFTLPDLGHVCAGDVALMEGDGASWISTTPRGILPLS